ncbi:hypothetical protein [Olivibacter sitiensis]|uniref:hypothetical protein n=1 Tax=Olivibacter sitiensis TaxID=376470 RepID=UPI000400C8BA|nr:hypothetical protein [Olivibacter sitiensis]
MKKITEVIGAAAIWLQNYNAESGQEQEMVSYGLQLIKNLDNGIAPSLYDNILPEGADPIDDITDLIALDREALLNFCRSYQSADLLKTAEGAESLIKYLSHSFARADDIQMVSVLLRLLVLIDHNLDLNDDGWGFLLSQQQADGSFGLLSAEMMLMGTADRASLSSLMMTIEVLTTLAMALTATRAMQHQVI